MKKSLHKLFIILLVLVLCMCMSLTAFATEYDMDNLHEGDTLTLYPGDTIKTYDQAPNVGRYISVIDGVGGSITVDANKTQPNVVLNSFNTFYGQKHQIFLGENSVYTVGSIYGHYSFDAVVQAPFTYTPPQPGEPADNPIVDANGNPINYTMIQLVANNPIKFNIKYDANGGTGSISPQQWVYTTFGANLSDGTGFSRDGYKLKGWAVAPEGDKNGDGIIDENDDIVTAALGESLNLGPTVNFARNIPLYGSTPTQTGESDLTLYAVWESTGGAGNTGNTNPPAGNTDNTTTDSTTKTTPKTADSNLLLPFISIMTVFGLGAALFNRKERS